MTEEKIPGFSTKEMVKFFENFDPIQFKYHYQSVEEMREDIKRYNEIVEYEKSNQKSTLTEKNYAGDYANLNLVYDEKTQNLENIRLLELISNKIISQYINISGMERLFSETYIEFEWEMHLSADYKKHNMKFYRDHFFHQIRDAYMMLVFMQNYGFYDYVKKAFETENGSKITRYVRRCLVQQEYAEKEGVKKLRKNDGDFYIRNLIYMSSLMAALFHDIGYPERFYMISGQHIMDYIANLHELNDGNSNMKRIYSLLQNSLLFRIVPYREIEKRICDVDDPDHGALSAIIFLLHFYENGAIYNLAPYKTAAVELAALAIFNHTNTFGLLGKKDPTAYRLCFSRNPISWLLRICDDLQEWQRIYFVISSQSNPVFCRRCYTPIIGKRSGKVMQYECNCKSALGRCRTTERTESFCFSQTFEGNAGFPYRRIYNVSVCDDLKIHAGSRIRFEGEKGDREKKDRLCIELHYNPYKLLHVAYVNHTYAKYRIKELNSVKKLFENQAIIPKIFLDYFVTSNPIHIKVKLLEDYLQNQKRLFEKKDKELLEREKQLQKEEKEIEIEERRLKSEGALTGAEKKKHRILQKEKEKLQEESRLQKDKELRCWDTDWLLAAAEQDTIFEGMEAELMGKNACGALIEEFILRTRLCKECAYCENFIHSIPCIFHEEERPGFSGCQNEADRRCLAWLVTLADNVDIADVNASTMKELLPEQHNVSKLIKEKNLSYPDFKKSIQEADEEQTNSIFFDDGFETTEMNLVKLRENCPVRKIIAYLKKALGLYVNLYLCQAISRLANMPERKDAERLKEAIRKRGRVLAERYKKFPEMQCLVEDCFLQFTRMYKDISEFDFYPEEYYNQYANGKRKQYLYAEKPEEKKKFERESEDYYYKALTRYMAPQLYKPVLSRKKEAADFIDAYTDLYLFQMMNEAIENNR